MTSCRRLLFFTRQLGALATAAVSVHAVASAQSVRGTVVDARGAPVAGALILLLDSGATPTASRALSDESGAYRLIAPRVGTYRLHAQRIGFRTVEYAPFQLANGEVRTQQLTLTGAVFSMDTMRVASRSSCRLLAQDSAATTFAVWEQVRLALAATELTSNARAVRATTIAYERTVDKTGRRVVGQRVVSAPDSAHSLWFSVPPETLHRSGYVVQEGDSVSYYAPGLEALLSAVFLQDHCLRLVSSPDTSLVGLAFEPTPARKRLAEIEGTLWLRRTTSELSRLEFRYTNVSREQANYAGGEMRFVRLRNGAWVVSRWAITMPVVVERRRATAMAPADRVVRELRVTGGELVMAVANALPRRDTLYLRPSYRLTGAVLDSSSTVPMVGVHVGVAGTGIETTTDSAGAFSLSVSAPGETTIELRTPWLDAAGGHSQSRLTLLDTVSAVQMRLPTEAQLARTVCRTTKFDASGLLDGIVTGVVSRGDDSIPPSRVTVSAQWSELSARGSGGGGPIDPPMHTLTTRSDARGEFRLCGVPLATPITIRATADGWSAVPQQVRFADSGRFARAEPVLLQPNAKGRAVFAGVVLADSGQRPIAGAEVVLDDLAASTRTNADGSFRVGDLTPGSHSLLIRRLGFLPLTTSLTFGANETDFRRIFLTRAVVLDSVMVSENAVLPSFEENRRIGLGHFLTRRDLATKESQTMSAVIAEFTGAKVITARAGRAWLASRRTQGSLSGTRFTYGDPADSVNGAFPPACYAQVWVDKTRVYSGKQGEPLFDLRSVTPDQVDAIEFYAGPSETPARYSDLNATCGVLVIWTRRSS